MSNRIAPYKDPLVVDAVARFYEALEAELRQQRAGSAARLGAEATYRRYLAWSHDSDGWRETLNYPQFCKVWDMVLVMKGGM